MLLLLSAPASRRTTIIGDAPPNALAEFWERIGLWGRIGLVAVLALVIVAIGIWAVRQIGRGNWRRLAGVITSFCLLCALSFGFWTLQRTTIGGPDLVDGQVQSYRTVGLRGTAQALDF